MAAEQHGSQHVGTAARAVARLAKIAERALAEEGLSLAQYRLLIYLADGTAAAKVLAARLSVSPPSVTSLVESMVERGLVTRGADASDRRRVTHVLTDAGREALARADRAVAAGLDDVASHVERGTARTAAAGLEAWLTALDAAVAHKQPQPVEGVRA